MYIAPINKNDNLDEVKDFIKTNGFGLLINTIEGRPHATHIPLMLGNNASGEDILSGHISKANPQWKVFEAANEVLVVFSGEHSYISSSWYDHSNVSTWNYIAVHIYGTLRVIEGEELLQDLKNLTNKYEANVEKPVTVESMGAKVVAREMRGIVGFQIKINEIQAAYKLSQNRDDHNHANIIKELEKTGDDQSVKIATAMRKNRIGTL
jgi:transcriptional regulator